MLVEFPLLKNTSHFPLHNMYEKCFPTSPPTLTLAHVLFPNLWHIFPLFSISPAPTLSFVHTTLFYNPCSGDHFHTLWSVKSQSRVSLSPPLFPTSKKALRHSRATLKVPSCFISQIAKVSKVSQRDSLDKGGMKADLLWVSQIFALIYWHEDTCVMCVLHMMVADLNVFLARASWTKTGQTSIQV